MITISPRYYAAAAALYFGILLYIPLVVLAILPLSLAGPKLQNNDLGMILFTLLVVFMPLILSVVLLF